MFHNNYLLPSNRKISNSLPDKVQRVLQKVQENRYWPIVVKTCKFIIHFVLVMVILYCGAVVFARLESGQNTNDTVGPFDFDQYNSSWKAVQKLCKYSVPEEVRRALWHALKNATKQDANVAHSHEHHQNESEEEIAFIKWWYFVIVATTTIGYGNVHPKTDAGKYFYMFFSIIGILFMMSLLRACGKMLKTLNKKLYTRVAQILWQGDKDRLLSDQLMSIVSLCLMFFTFMAMVVWHDRSHIENHSMAPLTMTDTLYFWMVTFTTVGFGDVHFPLHVEIEHFYELVICRVFGLSFLAGIIESIHEYLLFRKEKLIENNKRLQKLSQIIIGTATPIGLTAGFLPTHKQTDRRRKKPFYQYKEGIQGITAQLLTKQK